MGAGFASASTTSRPPGPGWHNTSALGGSCCSSCASTRNSLARCAASASDPVVRDVLSPHEVPVLMPALTDRESASAAEKLASWLAEPLTAANGANPPALRPLPLVRPVVVVSDRESATECAVPAVLA